MNRFLGGSHEQRFGFLWIAKLKIGNGKGASMEGSRFNEEFKCRHCGYTFFMAGGHEDDCPTFCPECGDNNIIRTKWNDGEKDSSDDHCNEAECICPGAINRYILD